jgi:glycolate oxidase FAD binding subunit
MTNYTEVLGTEPEQVALPATADEVAEVVRWANAEGKAVIPWGGGTGQAYGHGPRRADALLNLSGLNRVLAHEPGDLTVTVEPGVTLARLQETLAAHNQFLPLDPPHAETATLGGILATNAYGPSCLGRGTARDWLIGIRVVDAQGRFVKGGGKVVKNVTGYDLPKMHMVRSAPSASSSRRHSRSRRSPRRCGPSSSAPTADPAMWPALSRRCVR